MSEHEDHLNDLCGRGELGDLLALVSMDAVATTWCRYTERSLAAGSDSLSYRDPDWWAVNFFLCEGFWRDRDLRRRGLLALVRATDDERVLGCVGAGPLENFISDDEDDLRWLEEQAQQNDSLRIALRHVWADTYVTEATMARLDAAAGKALARVPRTTWHRPSPSRQKKRGRRSSRSPVKTGHQCSSTRGRQRN